MKGSTASTVSASDDPNFDVKANGYPLSSRVGMSRTDGSSNAHGSSVFYHYGARWVGISEPQILGKADLSQRRNCISIHQAIGREVVSADTIVRRLLSFFEIVGIPFVISKALKFHLRHFHLYWARTFWHLWPF